MSDHIKPTIEELDKKIQETEKALETTEEQNPPEENEDENEADEVHDENEEDTPDEEDNDEDESDISEETDEEVDEEDNPPETSEKPEEETDEETEKNSTEKQLKESTKEARKLAEDKKKMDEAFHEAHNIPEPTEEELKNEYPTWDEMDDVTRKLAKDNLYNKKRFEAIDKTNEQRRAIDEWNQKVDDYIDSPKTLVHNPDLEGKQDDFRTYAKDKKRRNINFDVMVKAFLYDQSLTKKKNKGKMFETGTAGDNNKPKLRNDKISFEEAERLRNTNYNKYKEYVTAGKIEDPKL